MSQDEKLRAACVELSTALDNFYDGAPDSGNAMLTNEIIIAWEHMDTALAGNRARTIAKSLSNQQKYGDKHNG